MNEQKYNQFIESVDAEITKANLRAMQSENKLSQISSFDTNIERGLAEIQLDLNRELDRIYHLLQGHVLVKDLDGNVDWTEPPDDRLKIFSEYGVKQIMNIISFYVSKVHVLSYYPDDQIIKQKVYDFGIELTDLIFNAYEHFFYYPKAETLFEKYKEIAKEKGFNISEEELYWKCVEWSEAELDSKLTHFPMICLSLIDSVHATLLKGLKGATMVSLRTMGHIHESKQAPLISQYNIKEKSLLKPSTW